MSICSSLTGWKVLATGFADDTTLLAYEGSAEANCRKLELAHERCMQWARRHGAQFAPDKYTLVHFTRRRDPAAVQARVNITGFNGVPLGGLKILGVWMDKKLT